MGLPMVIVFDIGLIFYFRWLVFYVAELFDSGKADWMI
jgi:hypothetical protein